MCASRGPDDAGRRPGLRLVTGRWPGRTMRRDGRRQAGRPRSDQAQPLWAPSATSAWATAKYLLLPRSRTVLMPNAAASFSASPSLTPASAATGASRISSRLLFS